jgi:hypothetical protein
MSDNLLASVQMQRMETAVTKWLLHELISRATVSLNNVGGGADLVLEAGTVLGQKTVNPAVDATVMAAGAGNTGNGAATIDAANPTLAGAQLGAYRAVCIAVAANAGVFAVFDPHGIYLGHHTVGGAAFATQIKFAIADGGVDFVAGDFFTITTSAGDGSWVAVNAAAVDGSNVAAAVLTARAFVPTNDSADAIALVREAAVIAETLIWPAGFNAAAIAAGTAQLLANRLYTVPRV